MNKLKVLIGGSPCTKWSIANSADREILPSGVGWELFLNYLIAKKKFKPDLFLYENNKSAAQPIKNQISKELGVDLMHINSALVSAQNRERFYCFNWHVDQPSDRGILLKDILEPIEMYDGVCYSLGSLKSLSQKEMEYMVREISDGRNHFDFGYFQNGTKDKAKCLTANVHKGVPYNVLAQPIRIGTIQNKAKNADFDSQQYRVYSPNGKSVTLCGCGGGVGAKTGLYLTPAAADMVQHPIYQVKDKQLFFNGENHYLNIDDGYYVIRKLTVAECCRLQTLPDDYCKSVSTSQALKGLGNGWNAETIIHILSGALKDVPKDYPIQVLSMYDGIGTGRYCFDKMGFTNVEYHAYEIDKYASRVATDNYPDIIHHGDAFQIREDYWTL